MAFTQEELNHMKQIAIDETPIETGFLRNSIMLFVSKYGVNIVWNAVYSRRVNYEGKSAGYIDRAYKKINEYIKTIRSTRLERKQEDVQVKLQTIPIKDYSSKKVGGIKPIINPLDKTSVINLDKIKRPLGRKVDVLPGFITATIINENGKKINIPNFIAPTSELELDKLNKMSTTELFLYIETVKLLQNTYLRNKKFVPGNIVIVDPNEVRRTNNLKRSKTNEKK